MNGLQSGAILGTPINLDLLTAVVTRSIQSSSQCTDLPFSCVLVLYSVSSYASIAWTPGVEPVLGSAIYINS